MALLLKDPESILDYSVDWGAEYLDGDTLAASDWSVSPIESGGLEVDSSQFDHATAVVKASGGIAGRIYRLINHVTLASGREDRRSILLRVEQR